MIENEMGKYIVDNAVQIHRETGPGWLETVYEAILAHPLRQQGFQVERQVAVPIEYLGLRFDEGFRADLVVEKKVVIELKCVEKLNNAHNDALRAWRLCESQLSS
ncbi:MAG: GxxExxY protein [Candidatus Thiodiazotropha sp. (ex Dulcina madagascariensis)]|nr:GxxExxY protein [Candidatus Thiodiazotropha sp. (ex Dulcina madagascariensis)]